MGVVLERGCREKECPLPRRPDLTQPLSPFLDLTYEGLSGLQLPSSLSSNSQDVGNPQLFSRSLHRKLLGPYTFTIN